MLGTSYYHNTIRNITVAMGSLFNNISIDRTDAIDNVIKTMKVPLSYVSRSHYWAKIKNQHDQIGSTLPRMSFFMEGLTYDAERQLNPLARVSASSGTSNNNLLRQFQPIPYDFAFNVSVYAKHVEDGLRIIEQILPTFTPSFNLTLNEIPSMNIMTDIPVILESVTQEDNYESGFEEHRLITWDLALNVKGHMYQPISDVGIIKQANVAIASEPTMTEKLQTLGIGVDPLTAVASDPWVVKKTITPGPNQ